MAIDIKEILANGLLDLCHKKDLSQITVKDLLETTGVSRQTFYNHFLDKNDLIQYIYNYKIINRFNGQNTNLDFYESLIESFEHMKQYQTFLKQACLMDGQNCLKEYISKHCEEFDLKWHQQLYGEEPMPDALKFATIYHANASSAMTLSWILSDMKKDRIQNGLTGKTDHILTLQPVPEKMHRVLLQSTIIHLLNLPETIH